MDGNIPRENIVYMQLLHSPLIVGLFQPNGTLFLQAYQPVLSGRIAIVFTSVLCDDLVHAEQQ